MEKYVWDSLALYNYFLSKYPEYLKTINSLYKNDFDVTDDEFYKKYFNGINMSYYLVPQINNLVERLLDEDTNELIYLICNNMLPKYVLYKLTNHEYEKYLDVQIIMDLQTNNYLPKVITLSQYLHNDIPMSISFIEFLDYCADNKILIDVTILSRILYTGCKNFGNLIDFVNFYLEYDSLNIYNSFCTYEYLHAISFPHCRVELLNKLFIKINSNQDFLTDPYNFFYQYVIYCDNHHNTYSANNDLVIRLIYLLDEYSDILTEKCITNIFFAIGKFICEKNFDNDMIDLLESLVHQCKYKFIFKNIRSTSLPMHISVTPGNEQSKLRLKELFFPNDFEEQ